MNDDAAQYSKIDPRPEKTGDGNVLVRYLPRSDLLELIGTHIYYSRNQNEAIKLNEYYIPVDKTSPKLKKLSDDVIHTNIALALCDDVIRRSKNGRPPRKALQKTVTNYWNTILFLRGRGVYSLRDATKADIITLCKEFSKGGWTSALEIERKVSMIIESLTENDLKDAIHVYGPTPENCKLIDSLKAPFWRSRIGATSASLLSQKTKISFEEKAAQFGYSFSKRWRNHFESEQHIPTENSYRNLIGFLNQLYHLPQSVDRLAFLPFDNPAYWSKKYAERTAGRTHNLDVDAASHILGKALDWIYDHGERLVTILEQCWREFPNISQIDRDQFLAENNPFEELAKNLGIATPNVWNMSLHPYLRPEYYQSVDELIGATQGACAVAIAGFNARRSSEVCDDETGLRESDFLLDEDLGFHKVNFYIEKSYQNRHWFYVNKATSDAIRLLIRLKVVSRPFNTEHTQDESLFRGHAWTKTGHKKTSTSFVFSRSKKQMRSLASFLKFLGTEYCDIELKSHMWRRFFSLIYIYRYDHSTLQSLSQHLRHSMVHRTFVYVTDPTARAQSERIAAKIPSTKQSKVMDSRLLNSLYLDSEELGDAIFAVKKEKLFETVDSILNGNRHSGGFPRLVRKLYINLSKNLNFSSLQEAEKARSISTTLTSRGYASDPMSHGQCNAPADSHTQLGRCSVDGVLTKEIASPAFCQNCTFHSKSDSFVNNLKDELVLIEADIMDSCTPDRIRNEAIEARKNLLEAIRIHNHSANINSALMQKAIKGD